MKSIWSKLGVLACILGMLAILQPTKMAYGATFNVPAGNTAALIQAINAANYEPQHPGTDTIVLGGGTYILDSVDNTEGYFNQPNGLPVIKTPIIIEGNGSTIKFKSSNSVPELTFFNVDADVWAGELTLRNMTLTNGNADRGIVHILWGRVDLENVDVINNKGYWGGAIYNDEGELNVSNSRFIGNKCISSLCDGAAISNVGVYGAAVRRVIVNNSYFENNTNTAYGDEGSGGAIYSYPAYWEGEYKAQIYNSTFVNNGGTEQGGAILLAYGGYVANNLFINNHALEGGAITTGSPFYLKGNTFIQNTAGDIGGALDTVGSPLIEDNIFYQNTAAYGGAIHAEVGGTSTGTVDASTFIENRATVQNAGDAIHVVDRSGFSYNTFDANNSCFEGNGWAFVTAFDHLHDATSNWWGDPAGPASGDKVSLWVDYANWLTTRPAICNLSNSNIALGDGGFENAASGAWNINTSGSGDTYIAHPNAYEGSSLFKFQANGAQELIAQSAAYPSGTQGDTVMLTAQLAGMNLSGGQAGAIVTLYNGGTKVASKTCLFPFSGSSFSWKTQTCTVFATGDYDTVDIKIGWRNATTGLIGLDDIRLGSY